MYLSQQKAGPGSHRDNDFIGRVIAFLRKSALWIGGIVFAALAAIGTFFFAMAAIVGTFILAAAIAFAWFLFKMLGPKAFTPKSFGQNKADGETLDATNGPEGWTVHDKNKFGE